MGNSRFGRVTRASVGAFVIVLIIGFVTYSTMNSRTFQLFGGIVNRGNTNEKVVALTFDDGPSPKVDTVLSILKNENVRATFFLIGREIQQCPEEGQKLVLAGQEIGNHTYSHRPMVFRSLSAIAGEIEETDSLIRELGYKGPIQFRPPFCKKLVLLPYYLKQHNRRTIIWDLEPNSYPEINSSSEKIIDYVLKNAKPGSIILLHPMYDRKGTTIGAIKGIIEGMKQKGYAFRTVSGLLEKSDSSFRSL